MDTEIAAKKRSFWTAIIIFLSILILSAIIYEIMRIYQVRIFHSFEKIKLKQKDLERSFKDTEYIEITIPKNSQVTAFQVQQKILKAFHSTYGDPIEGAHTFRPTWYFFQKMFRLWKVSRAKQTFFTMQIWAQYPFISLRLNIPTPHFDRLEKAIFNAYPNAEIVHLDKEKVLKLMNDALAQKPGADMIVNYRLDTTYTMYPFYIVQTIKLEGTAANMQVGEKDLLEKSKYKWTN